ncbi:TRAP transporter large permease [Pararhodobacter oceanensis]|uniref:TRAP transporter large permease protein n=1 Tax=Pararhodobacter oceanensis TaxID=2172121 RepID=A0A2T8HQ04_9RHOB|nr:TRAP transporter large permease [Pararhodobacter oceanensis]PVH27527.1 C4-dicarboxylate ABC transporter permease [Pararhodobacter oceanensis]
MSGFALGLSGIGLMFVLLFLRQPVWLSLAIVGILGNIIYNSLNTAQYVAGTVFFDTASNYNLSVVPLFVLMGEVASGSRMSSELFKAARVIVSGLRGGLAVASLAASGAFGAICGSSVATAATMTRIAMPEMRKAGYDDGYSSGAIAAGGSLGILIPPSIILVIYGSIAEQSIARLFAASLLPGIVLMLIYIAVALWLARRSGMVPSEVSASLLERLMSLRHAWQFALLFVISIGGIYAGVFSPNEAASIGAFGAIVLGLLRRSLDLAGIVKAVQSSVLVSCALFMIVIGATLFSQFIVQTRLPDTLLALAQGADLSPAMVMALIIVIYIVMGCFLEGIGMVLITVPVFLPVVVGYGFDPILFGVLVAVLVELGLITPPVGMNLFIIRAQVPDMSMGALYRGILPFLIAPVILIALIFAFPQLTLWLPAVLY